MKVEHPRFELLPIWDSSATVLALLVRLKLTVLYFIPLGLGVFLTWVLLHAL